jgi:hypothetical protein
MLELRVLIGLYIILCLYFCAFWFVRARSQLDMPTSESANNF